MQPFQLQPLAQNIGMAVLHIAGEPGMMGLPHLFRDDDGDLLADAVLNAENFLSGLVEGLDGAVGIDGDDAVGGVLHHGPQPRFIALLGLLGLFTLFNLFGELAVGAFQHMGACRDDRLLALLDGLQGQPLTTQLLQKKEHQKRHHHKGQRMLGHRVQNAVLIAAEDGFGIKCNAETAANRTEGMALPGMTGQTRFFGGKRGHIAKLVGLIVGDSLCDLLHALFKLL